MNAGARTVALAALVACGIALIVVLQKARVQPPLEIALQRLGPDVGGIGHHRDPDERVLGRREVLQGPVEPGQPLRAVAQPRCRIDAFQPPVPRDLLREAAFQRQVALRRLVERGEAARCRHSRERIVLGKRRVEVRLRAKRRRIAVRIDPVAGKASRTLVAPSPSVTAWVGRGASIGRPACQAWSR